MNNVAKIASGGPAGGQTFEKFDKQVLKRLRAPDTKDNLDILFIIAFTMPSHLEAEEKGISSQKFLRLVTA
ncbi:hypothetical protein [Desulfoluna sp.]|uniref:hypothetical protein n=1 Tax=Desulfoluna sp. TaxID=2045199 RepID=UPI002635EF71|nr:hypothetical protein [Desulfoluna sp.]